MPKGQYNRYKQRKFRVKLKASSDTEVGLKGRLDSDSEPQTENS